MVLLEDELKIFNETLENKTGSNTSATQEMDNKVETSHHRS